jgi:hypothetical protein
MRQELKILVENTTFEIDPQSFEDGSIQIAVWLKTFGQNWSICYQNGDMNGNHKGEAIYNNDGANIGLRECRNILKERPEFAHLIDLNTYWSYEELDELINEFCRLFAEQHKIAEMLTADEEANNE